MLFFIFKPYYQLALHICERAAFQKCSGKLLICNCDILINCQFCSGKSKFLSKVTDRRAPGCQ